MKISGNFDGLIIQDNGRIRVLDGGPGARFVEDDEYDFCPECGGIEGDCGCDEMDGGEVDDDAEE